MLDVEAMFDQNGGSLMIKRYSPTVPVAEGTPLNFHDEGDRVIVSTDDGVINEVTVRYGDVWSVYPGGIIEVGLISDYAGQPIFVPAPDGENGEPKGFMLNAG